MSGLNSLLVGCPSAGAKRLSQIRFLVSCPNETENSEVNTGRALIAELVQERFVSQFAHIGHPNCYSTTSPHLSVENPTVGCSYNGEVTGISGTGNPMVQQSDWVYPVVVLATGDNFSIGDDIEFVVKQELKSHYQAQLPENESELSSPTFHRIYRGEVSENSSQDNPIIRHSDWDKSVVIITEDSETFSRGDQVKFVVKKEVGQRYQALLSHKAPAVKPHYGSKAVIPIHHDGKDNQSVGDTRSESHATKSIDKRS